VNEVIIPNPRDYTLTPNGSLTLRTEHHGSTVVTATPIGGLSDTVSISCGALPIYVTCEVVPSSHVSISNGTPQNVTVKMPIHARVSEDRIGIDLTGRFRRRVALPVLWIVF
jgi:hypothetical protein